MATEDKRVTDLSVASPATGDLLYLVDVSDTTESADGSSKRVTIDSIESYINNVTDRDYRAGDVLNFGADATGASDSTSAFQDAIDSLEIVYVPAGDWRIDGRLTLNTETLVICEPGLLPDYRTWTFANQAPAVGGDGRHCRLFKDDTSTDTDFFYVQWGGVHIMGYPLLDVSDMASFTSAGVLFDIGSDNDNVTTGRPRIWGNRIEIRVLGNFDTISDAGEGPNPIRVNTTSVDAQNGYITNQKWFVDAQLVNTGLYMEPLQSGQFANSLEAYIDIDGCKQAVKNDLFNESEFHGFVQARDILDATEKKNPVCSTSGANCHFSIRPYDLSDAADGSGHYRMSYFLQNDAKGTTVDRKSDVTVRLVRGYPVSSQRLPNMINPRGIIFNKPRNPGDPLTGMCIVPFYNIFANLSLKSTLTWEVYEGQSIESETAVSDCVFANASGSTVDITSALGAIPTLAVGAKFDLSDHSTSDNNGEYEVLSAVTDGYNCQKQPVDGFTDDPANASSEAVTITTGFGAMTDDSGTESVTTSSEYTENGDLDNVGHMYGDEPRITFTANAVTDGDYLEYHITNYTTTVKEMVFAFLSDGGFTKVQVLRKNAGSIKDNYILELPLQADEDAAIMAFFESMSDTAADETIVRFIAPRDSGKAITIQEFAAMSTTTTSDIGFITDKGGQTVRGDMVMAANVDFTGIPTSDPASAGRLWNDGGTVKISAG